MLATPITVLLLVAVLAVFVVIGVRAGRERLRADVDDFTVARGTQGPFTLGLSFLASGLGAWILFAPPELGAILGIGPVIGYAVAAAAPFLVFAFVGPRLRRIVPSGHGLSEFLRVRFGPAASTVVTLVSLLYMGVFVAAELVVIGGLVELVGGVSRRVIHRAGGRREQVGATCRHRGQRGSQTALRTHARGEPVAWRVGQHGVDRGGELDGQSEHRGLLSTSAQTAGCGGRKS